MKSASEMREGCQSASSSPARRLPQAANLRKIRPETALLYELPPDSSGRGPPPPEWQRLRRAQWFAWMRDITAKKLRPNTDGQQSTLFSALIESIARGETAGDGQHNREVVVGTHGIGDVAGRDHHGDHSGQCRILHTKRNEPASRIKVNERITRSKTPKA